MTLIDPADVRAALLRGGVIPAHPLVLTADRRLDVARQRALTRYYLDAGVRGLAVGVHTTQFAIRGHGLYAEVLELAARTAREWASEPAVLVAGVVGDTGQAVGEATVAAAAGYHAVLANVAAIADRGAAAMVEHCRRLAEVLPVVGFSLLPACGGAHLPYDFWRGFCELDRAVAIKLAPFDRYRTVEILRAVVDARAEDRIALYTGNDDHIVLDLATGADVRRDDGATVRVRMRGGLLGQWSVWTRRAVELVEAVDASWRDGGVPRDLLALDARLTECNGAIYDAVHDFGGSVAGCLEVLRRQGFVEAVRVLDPAQGLAPGQADGITRVLARHRDLTDDDFVAAHLDRWLAAEPAAV